MPPVSLFADRREPPPIPATRSDSTGRPRRPLLIWIRAGAAHVRIDDAEAFRLTAGEGAWIPADGWHHRAIVTEPGTVAFPLWLHHGAEPFAEPARFTVPDGWQDWLIQYFNLQVTPLSSPDPPHEAIGRFLRRPDSVPPPSSRGGATDPSALLPAPELPRATGARAVAEQLLRDPALDLTVEQWATRVLSSPRSLRRDFLADTGLTFEQWRLHCRLTAAVELLAAGYAADLVAARVGFASRNGFTRAFKQQYGTTPHDFGRRVASSSARVDPTRRATLARQTDDLVRMVQGHGTFATTPELLPAARTAPHTNDRHVLSWMYRGSGYLDFGDHRYERQHGIATWIPAGVEHVTGLRENSISLPLGDVSTGDLRLTEPLQVRFSERWDDYLMFSAVAARSILQPDDFDPQHILELFTDQVAAQRAAAVPMPTSPRAQAVAMDYLRRIGESPAFDVPAEVHRAFRDETGMTFTRWCYTARMRIARDQLAGGARPTTVARRLGYAHLPTFSTAFTRFHGLPPREYQEREVDGTR